MPYVLVVGAQLRGWVDGHVLCLGLDVHGDGG